MAIDVSGSFWQFVEATAEEGPDEYRPTTEDLLVTHLEIGEAIRSWRPVVLRPAPPFVAGRAPPEACEWDPRLEGYVFENYCSLFAGAGELLDPEDDVSRAMLDRCLSSVLLHMAICELAEGVHGLTP